MNKIFKTIWDAETRQVVVVSELAKSKGKTKSSAGGALKAVVLAVAATAGIGAMQNVDAAMAVGGTGAAVGTTGNGEVTVVTGGSATAGTAIVSGAAKGMAIGENANVTFATTNTGLIANVSSIAIGNNVKALDSVRGMVLGTNATLVGANAVVIGNNATAIKNEPNSDNGLVVIGSDALIRNVQNSGQSRGSTAIGSNSLAGLLTDAGVANGTAVSTTSADYNTQTGGFTPGRLMYRSGMINTTGTTVASLVSNEATAIGFDSRAVGDQSVAIGAQTVAGHASVAIGGNDIAVVQNSTNNGIYKAIVGADTPINRLDPTTGTFNTTCSTANTWFETTYAKDGSVAIGAKAHSNALYGTALGTAAYVQADADLGTAIGTGARVGSQTQTVDANLTVTADFTTKGGVAIAAGSVAERDYTTAVGTGSKANQTSATAMGYQALASGVNATAVGAKAVATAADALAYGGNATSYAANAVAVGTNSTVTATGESSVAFGTDTSVSGTKTVALGSNIKNVSTSGSVVLGDSSTAVTGAGAGAPHAVGKVPDAVVKSANGAEITYGGFAGQPLDAGKYVSIGAVGAERQLKNVAAGNIAANSTDGINGSQLYSVTAALGNEVFKSTYFHVNNVTNAGTGDNTTNLGNISDAAGATGAYSVTAGVDTTAASNYSTAIGYKAAAGFFPTEASGMSEQVESIAIGKNATAEATQSIAIGTNATISVRTDSPSVYALPTRAITIGAESAANGLNSVALGPDALAGENFTIGANTIAIGNSSSALAQSAVAMGYNSNAAGEISVAIGAGASTAYRSDGSEAVAIGSVANASRIQATALGAKARADGANSLAMGSISHAASTSSIAMGTWTQAEGTSAQAIGHRSAAYSDRAMAEGHRAVAVNLNTSASGVRSVAAGVGSIAIGTNAASGATRADADAIIAANDAYTLAMYRDYIAQINLEADPTNVTTIAEAQTTAATLESTRKAVDDALAAARANAKSDTIAIGTGAQATHADAVALGSNSITRKATSENSATVGSVTYGGFAGNAPKSVVSFGKAGDERQLVNVAAGEISATSTDAINGSQLYFVAEQAAKPLTITANTNADTDAELLDKQYAAGDGTQQQLGETLAIIGAATGTTLARNTDKAVTGTYSAKNIQTVVSNGEVQIQMAENPEFKSIVVKADAADTNPVTITSGAGDTGGTISNLKTVIADPKGLTNATYPTNITTTNAATLGDVLNAGWNLQENGVAKDLVTPYDTVNFVNGTGTTVNITTENNVSKVRVDVNLSTITGDIKTDGTGAANATDQGSKLANVTTVTNAINNSGWRTNSTTAIGGATETLVNPGEIVNFEAGKNMTVTQKVTKDAAGKDVISYTYATKDDVSFNSTSVGGTPTTVTNPDGTTSTVINNPITIGTTPEGNNVISNLTSALPDTTSVPTTDKDGNPVPVTTTAPITAQQAQDLADKAGNNAATLGDVLNAGWNLQENGTAKDFVKPYDTVNFVNGTGTVANITSDGNVSNVTYNIAVDNKTTEITYTNAAGQTLYKQPDGTYNTSRDGSGTTVAAGDITGSQVSAIVPSTSVNGDTVTGPVNLINGDTTTVTNTDNGIKVEVKTGDSAVNNSGLATPYTDKAGNPVTKNADGTYTDVAGNPIAAGDVIDGSKQVATVGDIVNTINGTGWNLRENGTQKDLVTASNVVNFVNGAGTTAEVTSDGNVSNVTYNIAVDNKTTEITYTNAAGQTLYKQPDGTYNTSRDGSGTTVAAGDITGSQVSAIVPSTSVNGDTVTGPVNLINGDTTTVTNTGNGIKVEVNTGTSGVGSTGTATAVTDKNGNPLTATTDAAGNVTYTDASGNPVAAADVVDNSAKVATVGDIVNTINNVSWNVNSTAVGTGKIVDGSTTTPTAVKAGNTVSINAGNNIEITRDGQNVTVATSMNPTFTNVTATNSIGIANGPSMSTEGIDAAGKKITNVAPGTNPTDAVNVSQLKGYVGGAINALDKDLSAGVAGAMAGGNLYHATLPGKSMVSAGAATYRGQSAFAVGYSRLSDNGKYGIKVQVNTNTRGDTGAAASVGYQW
ncbi:YadA-like family protein [Pelistega suis]|uniref:YadA-like family protein n=1 Tax=Pelistega suis TaxID=1631957 RepID=UPI00211BBDD7|nr:YadA-like family protein [Pelistega suis]MCQ9328503.1 YadA-like family protein [Pelistega suis]